MTSIRIATRRSPLAMWQAEHVRDRLLASHPGLEVTLLPLSTQGDRVLDVALAKIGGKGLFVKELEIALLEKQADLAVHSIKDVPMALPDGLQLSTILAREDPRDALVSARCASLAEIPQGARVGTSSLRRQCQLRAQRPDLQVDELRGNVNTRLARLDKGDFDAIILACAGLARLDLADRIRQYLPAETMLPAVGQGAIGIEIRADDAATRHIVDSLDDSASRRCVLAERAMNRILQGGCQVPIAGHAVIREGGALWLRGLVGSVDGRQVLHAEAVGSANRPEELGRLAAQQLLDLGAAELLAPLRASQQ